MSTGTKVAKAAGILMVAMVFSRIIGYVRDVVIYSSFGQNNLTDAYNAAFSIPDFLYFLLVGGALSSAFIPVFSSYIATEKEEEGWKVASIIFNIVIILMLIGSTIGIIFAPTLIRILVPGFTPENIILTVKMTRIMFIQALFMALSGISIGILNSYHHFLSPAIGGIVYNLGIIVVGSILSPYIGIMGFSVGVVIGAVLSFAVQIPVLLKIGLRYKPVIDLQHPGVRKIGVLVLPVLIGLSVTQFNLFVNQNLGSNLPEGMISALRAAQRIMQLPIGIFAVSIAVATFPTLTGYAARKEKEEFKKTMSLGIRTIIFVTLPAAVGLIALRVPIVRLLFQQRQFTIEDTQATAYALLFYCFGLIAYSSIQLLNRIFYSLQDTIMPVVIGVVTIVVNIILNLTLIKPLGHGGLALAYSLAGFVNMVALLCILRRKIGSIDGRKMLASFVKTLGISLIMGVVTYETAQFMETIVDVGTKMGQVIQVGVSVPVGILVFGALVMLFKMEEGELAKKMLLRRVSRK
ncbi:MAG: murein biosynthesis integral membrane protein MurJ [Clostridia bacterium]|nr:murein biosynthesis integral membrane protein MurJ [Clostridia bacterium]